MIIPDKSASHTFLPAKDSVSRRFSYTLITVITLLMMVFSVAGILFTVAMMEKNLETRLDNAIRLASISLPTPLWNLDYITARDFVEALFLDEAVVHIELSWKGRMIAEKKRAGFDPRRRTPSGDPGLMRRAVDIHFEAHPVGTLTMVVSTRWLRHRVTMLIVAICSLTLLILLSVWLTSIAITRKYISDPLARLQQTASSIAGGDLDAAVDKAGEGEIGDLARHLDDMRRGIRKLFVQLQESKEEVEAYSQDLAAKVAVRTEELSRSVEELQALEEVSRAVTSTLDLETVLTGIVRHAVHLSSADAGTIYEYADDSARFNPRINYGTEPAFVEALDQAGLSVGDRTIIGQAALRRQAEQIPDLGKVPDYPLPFVRQAGFRALLALPLLREDRLIGGLIVRRRSAGAFPERVVDLLRTFADHSVLAIHNARLFQEIERKNREIQVATRHKSEFLANMSHELRTPLNAILGYTELVLDEIYGEVPDRIREVLERLQHNGRHLLNLINDVLDLSKIEAGQLLLSLDEYSVEEVVQAALAAVESLAAEKNLALVCRLPPKLEKARGDAQRITQVLLNFLGNAIKFTEEGEVRLTVAVEEEQLHISVSDTGAGISPEDQTMIFEAFQQADGSSTREKGGTGLGLSIARRIVEMHGGEIWVASVPGEGATFHVKLPLVVTQQKAFE